MITLLLGTTWVLLAVEAAAEPAQLACLPDCAEPWSGEWVPGETEDSVIASWEVD